MTTKTASPAHAPGWPVALQALSHPNFRLYWTGQVVSLAGTWMQQAAQQWLVYRLTGSPFSLGAVMFANQLPNMLFMLFTGVVADRVDKRRLIIITQACMMVLAFVLATLTFSGYVQYWHVLVIAALSGTINAFDMPARQSFTVEMVGKEDLLNAIALNASAFNIARLAGPAVSGLLVAAVGEAWSFAFNGLSFLAVLAGLLLMHLPVEPRVVATHSPLLDLKEGLTYIRETRPIFLLVASIVVPSLVGFNYVALLPVFAGDVLKIGPQGFGLLASAIGGGALVGALTLASIGTRLRRGRMVAFGSLGFAAAQFAFAWSRTPLLSIVLLFLVGWAMTTHLATTNTLIQTQVADRLRGRVMGTYMWVLLGAAPLGSLLVGAIAEQWGAPIAVAVSASLCGIVALGFALRAPEIRHMV